MTKRLHAAALLAALLAGNAAAAGFGGGFAFPAIQDGGSARAIALGSTYVGIAEGSASILWNPAGLATLPNGDIGLHNSTERRDGMQDIVTLALPLAPGDGLGLSGNYYNENDGRGDEANAPGDGGARSYGGSLGWGVTAGAGLSLGVAVKLDDDDRGGGSTSAFAGDLGALWQPASNFSVGAAYTNLGSSVDGRPLAQGFGLGASTYAGKSGDFQALFALSGEALTRGDTSLRLGYEQTLFKYVALRAGYGADLTNSFTSGLQGFSFGGGVNIQRISIDYAYMGLAGNGNNQRVSVTYAFGERCPDTVASQPAAPVVESAAPAPRPTPAPTPAPVPAAAKRAVPAAEPWARYVVRKGDSLWSIAAKKSVLGNAFHWPLLYKANRDQITDPDRIDPRQRLRFRRDYTAQETKDAERIADDTRIYVPHTGPREGYALQY